MSGRRKTTGGTPAAKKAAATKAAAAVAANTADIGQLAERMSKASLKDDSGRTDFSFNFPKLLYTCRSGNKDVAFYEFLTVAGPELMRHVKVLQGGTKMSLLFGYPRDLASERASKKFLASIGITYDGSLARVSARSSQVGHLVNTTFEHSDELLEGTPQVVSLPFACVEGEVSGGDIKWFKWYKKEKVKFDGKNHKQFYDILLVKLTSQKTYATEREDADQHILDDSENDSIGSISISNNDMNT
jgi:hypothetical protein